MTDDDRVAVAVQALSRLEQQGQTLDELREHLKTVAEDLRNNHELSTIRALHRLSDDVKILIIQQYFQHAQTGSHKTEFDQITVSRLLSSWFGITLEWCRDASATKCGQSQIPPLPGRSGWPTTCRLEFGDTEIFLYMSEKKRSIANGLVRSVARDAVLTTDTTSPPCEIAEFVPLWLQDRNRETDEYYINETDDHPIASYFDAQETSVREELGVDIHERSTEIAIIANGHALRFHRDRLVSQYAYLQQAERPPNSYRLVQDLTLIDWDMQSDTISGTLFDHPNSDRYLFCLHPGEVVGLFFSESVRFPGPMMMPYHCALPVMDNSARRTVGSAKGKRLSALVRGLADAEQLSRLRRRSSQLVVNELLDGSSRTYVNGVRVLHDPSLPQTLITPIAVINNDEGLSIVELRPDTNLGLLHAALRESADGARLFRVEKHGDGFSELQESIPQFSHAERVVLVNRSRYVPESDVSYPLALDFTQRNQPWVQMFRLATGSSVELPVSERELVRLVPPDEILHRSALLDSFYPTSKSQDRMVNAVDVIVR